MRSALVTGAAQGVGLATAEALASCGYEVTLVDVKPMDAALQRLAQLPGTRVHAVRGDVTSEEFAAALAEQVTARYGALDVLVNNAGISLICPAERTTLAQWRHVMEINLLGPFLLSKTLGAQMLAHRSGAIVNVASIAGLAGISQRSAYNASKHGLVGLTRTLAAEWGGRGVRVNAVCPGWIKTEMDAADQKRGAYADADITDRVPMARFASARDVAAAIVYLADPQLSAFVNGVCLPVDGGWTADAGWDSLRLAARGP
ncbi:MAG TPA: SDR family oxidoreductase [Steroidobacteraceae bacterium]|jgi:NAD(P)-dependent dehydrogenase (short-subunit alcohol dehydrogenase family)